MLQYITPSFIHTSLPCAGAQEAGAYPFFFILFDSKMLKFDCPQQHID